jgi:hypothetical protein
MEGWGVEKGRTEKGKEKERLEKGQGSARVAEPVVVATIEFVVSRQEYARARGARGTRGRW